MWFYKINVDCELEKCDMDILILFEKLMEYGFMRGTLLGTVGATSVFVALGVLYLNLQRLGDGSHVTRGHSWVCCESNG